MAMALAMTWLLPRPWGWEATPQWHLSNHSTSRSMANCHNYGKVVSHGLAINNGGFMCMCNYVYIYKYVKFKVSKSKFKSSGPGNASIITILINQHHQHQHHQHHRHHHHQVTQLANNNHHHHNHHHHHHHHHHHFSPLTTVANHRRCHCRGCCSFTASLAKDRLVIGKKN